MLLFPATQLLQRLFCQRICGKDQKKVFCWLSFFNYLTCFGPLIPFLIDLSIMLSCYPLILIFEFLFFLLMLCSFLCYFGVYRLKNKGVFVYSFKVTLIGVASIPCCGDMMTHTITLTLQYDVSSVSIDHYPFRRVLQTNPIKKIFKDMDMDIYNFGDIDGLELMD